MRLLIMNVIWFDRLTMTVIILITLVILSLSKDGKGLRSNIAEPAAAKV